MVPRITANLGSSSDRWRILAPQRSSSVRSAYRQIRKHSAPSSNELYGTADKPRHAATVQSEEEEEEEEGATQMAMEEKRSTSAPRRWFTSRFTRRGQLRGCLTARGSSAAPSVLRAHTDQQHCLLYLKRHSRAPRAPGGAEHPEAQSTQRRRAIRVGFGQEVEQHPLQLFALGCGARSQ
ncbi:hypothetical protein EYF80_038611 [Liparis tanakae]|uniref:Uncharacterized protein n=1 Tax=Liparis tanakae TaxID=230148 RepID=A0A4Z2GE74_9TELE|nr:hypothetical protein EYF80_038611 [Liparis tanakae]